MHMAIPMTTLMILFASAGLLNLSAVIAVILCNRPHSQGQAQPAAGAGTGDGVPFVSIHVAVHDEPPFMVIQTLDALAKSDYPRFEVILIDNNTPDVATWQPVAAHIARLGPRFRFLHVDGVKGAKAGALNIALDLADARTSYVGVVDADYQVTPDFITTAIAACGPSVQFVQFPQAYRHAAGATIVEAELADYFTSFPKAANRAQASLLTGTLSIISVVALRQVGGWPTRSITEDAELGVKLWQAGARGLYLDKVGGHGLLPLDLQGLRLQRHRWVAGNAQTLLRCRNGLLRSPWGAAAVVAQLTAWIGFFGVPLVTLILVAASHASPDFAATVPPSLWRIAEAIAVTTILLALLTHLVRSVETRRLGSMAVTLALLWTSSFAWFAVIGSRTLRFRRTPKSASGRGASFSIDFACSVVALAAAMVFAAYGSPITSVALLLCASGLVTGPLVDRALRQAAARNAVPCPA